jgi:hypothetical protein
LARVARRHYEAAVGDSVHDRLAYLKAYRPEKYDRTKRVAVSIEDVRAAMEEASDDDILATLALGDSEPGEG